MPYPRYLRLRRVLVYPSTFLPRTVVLHGSSGVVRPDVPLLGQAWQGGIVVLGWDAVRRGALTATDGHNVVLHEFAHMLDAEDGSMDGVPVLDTSSAYRAWGSMLSTEFAEHVARTERGEDTALDSYGAENPAEFFAVATETFYERPFALRRDQPDLFASLVDFFGFDPTMPGPPPLGEGDAPGPDPTAGAPGE
jgi:Mlc titration factor MtfA (ptsG expression regulator)